MAGEPISQFIHHTKESYGESFKADLFEQYKLYIASTEKISERRVSSNNYLLTVNAFLVTTYGLLSASKYNSYWIISIPLAGILVSLTWYRIITAYRDLNSIKFKVIHKLEEQMPAALYGYEWKLADEGRGKTYQPLSQLERWIPIIFIIIYILASMINMIGMLT